MLYKTIMHDTLNHSKKINQDLIERSFKFLPLLTAIYITTLIASDVFVNKLIGGNHFFTSAAVITFPFTFIIADIITEIYGYKIARQLTWIGIACDFLFVLLTKLVIFLPWPMFWTKNLAYQMVLGNLLQVFFASLIAAPIGDIINIYAISKWKILLRGKYFWLRSITSTAIGSFAYTFICGLLIFITATNFHNTLTIIIGTYIIKLAYVIILAAPANFVIGFLKKAENIDVYDYNTNFNPFKLSLSDNN